MFRFWKVDNHALQVLHHIFGHLVVHFFPVLLDLDVAQHSCNKCNQHQERCSSQPRSHIDLRGPFICNGSIPKVDETLKDFSDRCSEFLKSHHRRVGSPGHHSVVDLSLEAQRSHKRLHACLDDGRWKLSLWHKSAGHLEVLENSNISRQASDKLTGTLLNSVPTHNAVLGCVHSFYHCIKEHFRCDIGSFLLDRDLENTPNKLVPAELVRQVSIQAEREANEVAGSILVEPAGQRVERGLSH